MAITRDEFKQVPSTGIIPDDRVPASEFAVGFAFTYQGNVDITNFNQSFTARVVYHVTSPGDVKYLIRLIEPYNLFIIPLAPALAIYTWNWVPSGEVVEGFKFAAPIPIAPGFDPPEIAQGQPMQTLGEASFGVDPAEGSGTTNGTAFVQSNFYSKIFTEPLSPGDKIKIRFHNISAGFVVSRASLLLATERVAAGLDTTFDRAGALLHARVPLGQSSLFTGRAWPSFKHRDVGRLVPGTRPSLVELPDGREILAVKLKTGEYVEFESLTSEWSWERAQYPDKEKGFGKTIAALWTEAKMPLLAAFGKTRVTLDVQGGYLLARRVTDDEGPSVAARVLLADSKQTYSISADNSGTFWISDLSGKPVAKSDSDGATWQVITAEVAA
jgi:hypothetical protein